MVVVFVVIVVSVVGCSPNSQPGFLISPHPPNAAGRAGWLLRTLAGSLRSGRRRLPIFFPLYNLPMPATPPIRCSKASPTAFRPYFIARCSMFGLI
ncbi:hypothetical protein FN846DRAFT_410973 [Sphaerosporella brunnea]|uniref:Secreted protein n=1 Tax=Sphaerosporella brunnea TaxID=1250544 RepID=A0A5J5EHA7_9PEZI|nr:hypothetical protein FN846DRAFT_410973 [Sphaerosporella brunnea]